METNIIARLATEEEKQDMFDALEKAGKKWDPETKQIEDILKVGDLAIFWGGDKKDACISTYTELKYPRCTHDGFNYASTIKDGEDYICWKNAIKCTSLEQYINFKK